MGGYLVLIGAGLAIGAFLARWILQGPAFARYLSLVVLGALLAWVPAKVQWDSVHSALTGYWSEELGRRLELEKQVELLTSRLESHRQLMARQQEHQ